MFDMHGETVCYNEKRRDRGNYRPDSFCPVKLSRLNFGKKEEMYDAIKRLAVRGAPAIGVFAAIGLSVLAARDKTADEKNAY